MKNKLTLLLIALTLLISIIPFSLAETYPVNKPVDLKFLCTLNNAVPTSATYNITISYPNGSTFINNKVATPLGQGAFNYTVNFLIIGTYKIQSFCYDGTYSYSNNEEIEITSTGTILSVSQAIIYFVFLIAAIGLFILCLNYSIKIPWSHQRNEDGEVIGINDLRYLKMFLVVSTYIMLMFVSGLLRSITANFIPEIGVSLFFEWVFWIMLSFMYPLIIISFIVGIILFLNNKKLQKAISRGFPIK